MKQTMSKNRTLPIVVGIVILVILAGVVYWSKREYKPVINPANFVSRINNKYFTLIPDRRFIYESKTEEGVERIEVAVTRETKKIMGVTATVVWDRVFLNDELREDTKDWFAQDKDGNVWYFGEDTVEFIAGKVVSRAGSWEAGVDGAKAGIIMKAKPKIGETYRQEYYRGKAEDMGKVLALITSVTVPAGTFKNCLQTLDYTRLEPSAREHKFYCPEVGGVALEIDLEGNIREELISIDNLATGSSTGSLPGAQPSLAVEELKTEVTQEQAKEIALQRVSGIVTDVAVEEKFGRMTFVVEIAANNGVETDVVIDVNTGEVLAVET